MKMFRERKERHGRGEMGGDTVALSASSWRRRTERPEHFLVNLHLLAVALLEAECGRHLKLIHGEAAIAVKVELLESLAMLIRLCRATLASHFFLSNFHPASSLDLLRGGEEISSSSARETTPSPLVCRREWWHRR